MSDTQHEFFAPAELAPTAEPAVEPTAVPDRPITLREFARTLTAHHDRIWMKWLGHRSGRAARTRAEWQAFFEMIKKE